METVIANYPKSAGVLYNVTGMVCQSCLNNLGVFAQFKSKYTEAFVASILKASTQAQAMPNNESRQAVKKTKRAALTALNAGLCGNVLTLLMYIGESFAAGDVENMKQLAGAGYYLKATRSNWEAGTTMINMAESFMDTYADELAAGGLPANFATDFGTNAGLFSDALKTFLDFKNTAEQGTSAKITANNAVFARVQQVMEDGKYLFRGDAVLQKQFSYNALIKKAAGPGKTGCRVVLQIAESLLPITSATIYLQPGNHQLTANKKGICKEEVPAGDYNFVITAPGFTGTDGQITINAGSTRRLKFVLAPAVADVATA